MVLNHNFVWSLNLMTPAPPKFQTATECKKQQPNDVHKPQIDKQIEFVRKTLSKNCLSKQMKFSKHSIQGDHKGYMLQSNILSNSVIWKKFLETMLRKVLLRGEWAIESLSLV